MSETPVEKRMMTEKTGQEIVQELKRISGGEGAEESEAWAVGERGGVPVSSTDPTYNNNSKYYAERAEDAAIKQPRIGANGDWETWDAEDQEWEDTGKEARGPQGNTGATPNMTIGTVSTLGPNDSATATITGTPENPVLNLGLPRGKDATIAAQVATYATNSSPTNPPSSGWSTTIPSVTPGEYLWVKLIITWTDGETSTIISRSRDGIDGSGAVSSLSLDGVSLTPGSNHVVTIPVDSLPTANSHKLVTSGTIYENIYQEVQDLAPSAYKSGSEYRANYDVDRNDFVLIDGKLYKNITKSRISRYSVLTEGTNVERVSNTSAGFYGALNTITRMFLYNEIDVDSVFVGSYAPQNGCSVTYARANECMVTIQVTIPAGTDASQVSGRGLLVCMIPPSLDIEDTCVIAYCSDKSDYAKQPLLIVNGGGIWFRNNAAMTDKSYGFIVSMRHLSSGY